MWIPKLGELERMHEDDIKREIRKLIDERDEARARVKELEAKLKVIRKAAKG